MAKVGYDALGLDIAPTAVQAATAYNAECLKNAGKDAWRARASFATTDFFSLTPPPGGFDLIYDYTFLCALDPPMRQQWAETMKRLLKPTGQLVTLIFPLGDYAGGPPHAMSKDLVSDLLINQGFESTYLQPVDPQMSHPGRGGKEMLGLWRLKN
eukprot:Tamp_27439.p1 GENE.Tamp_27439~~Tamp_27439.p1  ORF type:complete len:155 (-),score=21.57 Tamp_27439:63-527(-)